MARLLVLPMLVLTTRHWRLRPATPRRQRQSLLLPAPPAQSVLVPLRAAFFVLLASGSLPLKPFSARRLVARSMGLQQARFQPLVSAVPQSVAPQQLLSHWRESATVRVAEKSLLRAALLQEPGAGPVRRVDVQLPLAAAQNALKFQQLQVQWHAARHLHVAQDQQWAAQVRRRPKLGCQLVRDPGHPRPGALEHLSAPTLPSDGLSAFQLVALESPAEPERLVPLQLPKASLAAP
mmetsp:Transcript_34612/g.90646  ORF Transcript_34612/g.90646 Transcript_34612/m.90646 type:complete len:236 (-) Transcript_34612:2312-3019(-)